MTVAEQEKTPDATRVAGTRTRMQNVGVGATAVIAIVVVVVILRLPGLLPAADRPSASPTVAARATPRSIPPGETPQPTTAPFPSTVFPTQTASPAETELARQAVNTYTSLLIKDEYATAWAMLAPTQQARLTLDAYAKEAAAFFPSTKGQYEVVTWPSQLDSFLLAPLEAPVDLRHAVLVEVRYPVIEATTNAWDVFIVAIDSGKATIYKVR